MAKKYYAVRTGRMHARIFFINSLSVSNKNLSVLPDGVPSL